MSQPDYDVIVLGAGNAALSAAISAAEHGARVLVIERAPFAERGGNSAYTEGGFLFVHRGLKDIHELVPDLSQEEIAMSDFGSYTREEYLDKLGLLTQYHIDPDLAETLVHDSTDAVLWLQRNGVRFAPKYGRQAHKINGKYIFGTGVVVAAIGGGIGLVDFEFKAAEKLGAEVRYNVQTLAILRDAKGVRGIRVFENGSEKEITARAVVLGCGGYEASSEARARYMGPGWELVMVRGTRYNTGDGIRMALEIGAQPHGHWSSAHAVAWERNAPKFGDLKARTSGQRHSYDHAIIVNADGNRFVDEGADWRDHTYGKYGRMVLHQPGGYAWQVFDAVGTPFQRDDYRLPGATKVEANTLEELVDRMGDVNREQFLKTVRDYNAAVQRDIPFDPNKKDGRGTSGLPLPKSNWANPIEKPPFQAFAVGTGITFTFGGVKINTSANVLDLGDNPLKGLYAAGELVGGIWYFNYLGGAGLMAGTVFGRIAGREAAKFAVGSEQSPRS